MRITKSRLMRGTTINPNPPICKSKEPSFTYIRIFSCTDDHLIDEIAHYDWNWTQAHAAADGGTGTYTKGYFYEAAFKKTTPLDQKHCASNVYLSVKYIANTYIAHTTVTFAGKKADSPDWGFDGRAYITDPQTTVPPTTENVIIDQVMRYGTFAYIVKFTLKNDSTQDMSYQLALTEFPELPPLPPCDGDLCIPLPNLEDFPEA